MRKTPYSAAYVHVRTRTSARHSARESDEVLPQNGCSSTVTATTSVRHNSREGANTDRCRTEYLRHKCHQRVKTWTACYESSLLRGSEASQCSRAYTSSIIGPQFPPQLNTVNFCPRISTH
eukprot:scpid38696/ scgid28080/ 